MSPLVAYIDPGSGAIILQFIVAGIFGAAFMFRRAFGVPARMLSRLFGRKSGAGPEE